MNSAALAYSSSVWAPVKNKKKELFKQSNIQNTLQKNDKTTLYKLHLFRPHSSLRYIWHIITEGKEDVRAY